MLASIIQTLVGSTAFAVDLSITGLEVTQSIQHMGSTMNPDNSLTLIRGRRTTVRMYIDVGGTVPVAGVDGNLQVLVNGVPMAGSPFSAENGPITAPVSPDREETNHTLNFEFQVPGFSILGPLTSNVQLIGTVDPAGTIAETNEANNSTTSNHNFECRRSPSIGYVPINYTFPESDPSNMGLPSAFKMSPGIGDDFIWHTYPIPDPPNYYQLPGGATNLTTDVDLSIGTLLSDLDTRRVMTVPTPDLIYGWMPGNPIAGNGWATVGGTSAFGNTQDSPNRYQRTFAHEVGHLFGLDHNYRFLDPEVGFDGGFPGLEVTATDDCDPSGIQGTKCRALKDFMYPAQLTTSAWIDPVSYGFIASHPLVQSTGCRINLSPISHPKIPRIREIVLMTGLIPSFVPVGCEVIDCCPGCPGSMRTKIYELRAPVELTPNNPKGTKQVQLRDPNGKVLFEQNFDAAFGVGDSELEREQNMVPFTLVLPRVKNVAQVVLLSNGKEIFKQVRSFNRPIIRILSPQAGGELNGSIVWEGLDKDKDPLTYSLQYSPDGGRTFVSLAANLTGMEFSVDPSQIPGSRGLRGGLLRLIATDGLNTTITQITGLRVPEKLPTVQILKPAHSMAGEVATIRQGSPLILVGQGQDLEDGPLANGRLQWLIGGRPVGRGRVLQIDTKTLRVGPHQVTLIGVDSSKNQVRATAKIIIGPHLEASATPVIPIVPNIPIIPVVFNNPITTIGR